MCGNTLILYAKKCCQSSLFKASHDAITNIPNLEHFILTIQHKLSNIDIESKGLALDAVDITVWLGGQSVEVGAGQPVTSHPYKRWLFLHGNCQYCLGDRCLRILPKTIVGFTIDNASVNLVQRKHRQVD
jgi:hypothetical protein